MSAPGKYRVIGRPAIDAFDWMVDDAKVLVSLCVVMTRVYSAKGECSSERHLRLSEQSEGLETLLWQHQS